MVIWYSGTGNSEFCAKRLAKALDDECTGAFEYIWNGIAGEFVSGKPWVFVSPTYGWRLPRIFESFIRSASFAGAADAYFVMTCGTDTGAAPGHNAALCEAKGLKYRGTFSVVMPENYVAMFAVPGEAEAGNIVRRAIPELDSAAERIKAGEGIADAKPGVADRLKSGLVNDVFYRFVISSRRFTVSSSCIGCGKCERLCPTRCIELRDGKPVWGSGCTHCMACICSCPEGAIEYGRASVGKPRYHCPEIEE